MIAQEGNYEELAVPQ
ncbi:High mobility group protein HMG-I/HMG-Y [Caenorhabditis elegans]|uniref:High mobility group protein HMG-I/HMG-Y n=1 Tax=Caenorhabditis elegans TaxID=6239 RepID=H2KMM2_CAEEL|nr:High mobility group protein HMG-I/HMG-Y [Caenorhabditis elegans]CCE71510.1 High mobility group protein HMG-I/HMG-Y [Caenorhabditis elegans]|eukprot:NP_001255894.1 Uncharacterized protein CELE_Y51H4A.938 [Caenorhabditis elegans]